jgi:hypothetical protein
MPHLIVLEFGPRCMKQHEGHQACGIYRFVVCLDSFAE